MKREDLIREDAIQEAWRCKKEHFLINNKSMKKTNNYSLLENYKEILELLSSVMEAHGVATQSGEQQSKEDEEMYNILNTAYDLMVRAEALIGDRDSYVLIDEDHPFCENGKPKLQFKYAVSNIDTNFIKAMTEKTTRSDIIKVIKKEMTEQGLTIYRLSQISGVPETTIQRLLAMENKPSLDAVLAILAALHKRISID